MSARATTLVRGEGAGAPLRLDEPLSFWGGLDPLTRVILDRWHPQAGQCVAGRALLMPSGRGSSSGSAALAEALRLGVSPAAILMLKRDPIVVVGALAAAELYRCGRPVVLASPDDWQRLAAARRIAVKAAEEARLSLEDEGRI
ncbi:MAG: aconitase X swivel domain-containing protein [Roseiarcus sp.]